MRVTLQDCPAVDPTDGYVCTLPRGHAGSHTAHGAAGDEPYATWTDTPVCCAERAAVYEELRLDPDAPTRPLRHIIRDIVADRSKYVTLYVRTLAKYRFLRRLFEGAEMPHGPGLEAAKLLREEQKAHAVTRGELAVTNKALKDSRAMIDTLTTALAPRDAPKYAALFDEVVVDLRERQITGTFTEQVHRFNPNLQKGIEYRRRKGDLRRLLVGFVAKGIAMLAAYDAEQKKAAA